jgi:hypothetical protein
MSDHIALHPILSFELLAFSCTLGHEILQGTLEKIGSYSIAHR